MAIRTQIVPTRLEEVLDEQDRSQIHDIIEGLRQSYKHRLTEAVFEHNRAQRQVNRAAHEISRLERHLERMNAFCEKHNIPYDGREE